MENGFYLFFSVQKVVAEGDKPELLNVWTTMKNLRIEIVVQLINFHLIDTAILLSAPGGRRETGAR